MLKEMFAEIGEGCYIESPFHANWGGKHCHFGKMVYANFNLTCVDDTHIYVGDYTMIGPNVTIASAGHPIQPELRQKGYQYNMPVKIGKNCWIGAGEKYDKEKETTNNRKHFISYSNLLLRICTKSSRGFVPLGQ